MSSIPEQKYLALHVSSAARYAYPGEGRLGCDHAAEDVPLHCFSLEQLQTHSLVLILNCVEALLECSGGSRIHRESKLASALHETFLKISLLLQTREETDQTTFYRRLVPAQQALLGKPEGDDLRHGDIGEQHELP